MRPRHLSALIALAAMALSACGQPPAPRADGQPQVVASTSIVADVVRQIGGDRIALSTLVPIGADAHSFSPTPQDIARVSAARLIFINGAGYESFLDPLLQSAGGAAEVVDLSRGLTLRAIDPAMHAAEGDHAGDAHDSGDRDPHTWTDPNNVKVWASEISAALGRIDQANARFYAANAESYNAKLSELDSWAGAQFAAIPADQRLLVTDHLMFGYLADRYGLTQVGAIIPSSSSAAEASAQDLAALQDQIRRLGVRAIFVGNVSNPSLADRLAADTGTKVVTVLTESLTPPDGPGPTYLDYMRYNVGAIAGALK